MEQFCNLFFILVRENNWMLIFLFRFIFIPSAFINCFHTQNTENNLKSYLNLINWHFIFFSTRNILLITFSNSSAFTHGIMWVVASLYHDLVLFNLYHSWHLINPYLIGIFHLRHIGVAKYSWCFACLDLTRFTCISYPL